MKINRGLLALLSLTFFLALITGFMYYGSFEVLQASPVFKIDILIASGLGYLGLRVYIDEGSMDKELKNKGIDRAVNMKHTEIIVFLVSGGVWFMYFILSPLVWFDYVVIKLLGYIKVRKQEVVK